METKEQQASRLFNTACECIKSEKYKEAYNYLTRSSKLSNADARYILGIWLLFGVDCINLEQQIPEAIFCLIKSANKGNICSKNLLNTFLEIDDIEELGKEDIKDIVHLMNEKETKDNAIKNFIKENKCKILNAINNLCIIRPIIKTEQLELNKTTPLEQHNNVSIEYNEHEKHDEFESRQITQSITKENISSKHNKEKADEFKPKHIHNQINDKYLLDLLIKDNRQLKQENKMLKQENEMLKQENEMLKQENEMLKQDNKQSKQELQNIYIMLNNNVPMQQQIISQNTQINTNTIQQNEYMQTINFNQQIPNGEMIQMQQIQPIAQQNMYNEEQIINYNYLQQQNTLNTNINYQDQIYNINQSQPQQTIGTQTQMPQLQYNQFNNTQNQIYQTQYVQFSNAGNQFNNTTQHQTEFNYNYY